MSIVNERTYIEHKNIAIKNIINILKDKNKKLIITNDYDKCKYTPLTEMNENNFYIYVYPYEEYKDTKNKNRSCVEAIISYKDATGYIYIINDLPNTEKNLKYYKKSLDGIIDIAQNVEIECNICLEKKGKGWSCHKCNFVCCEDCDVKRRNMALNENKKIICPLCRQ